MKERTMDAKPYWNEIQQVVDTAMKSVHHVTMATVNPDGTPHLIPIGSLMMFEECRGVYCEIFPKRSATNLDRDPRVSIMAVNNGFGFWLKSLFKGKFATLPGVRLTGKAGKRRQGTPEELELWQNRVRHTRRLKGHALLWKDIAWVRDIYFDTFEPIYMGRMTQELKSGLPLL